MRKYLAFLATILSITALTSCNKVKNTVESSAPEVTALSTTTTEPVTTFTQAAVSTEKIKEKDFYQLYEAEEAKLSEGLRIAFDLDGYNGNGYVTGFADKSSVTFDIDAPTAQHYDLSFCIASGTAKECRIMLNDEEIPAFTAQEGNTFTYITVYGVYLEKGKSELVFTPSGDVALDYLKITNSSVHTDSKAKASSTTAVKKATDSAKELKKFLADSWGKYILTGQYVSDSTDSEMELIYRTTGKYPAIRFSDADISEDESALEAVKTWDEKGGINCLSWYWKAPSKKSAVRADETDFKLADAVTEEDIAALAPKKIQSLAKKKKIPQECADLVNDIDAMAEQLKKLGDTAILWRPLPEGGGNWYWWGADGAENYKWLWNLMYKRMTEYHKLDNLLWVWNGQTQEAMPENFDIAAADLYVDGEKDYGSRFSEAFAAVQSYVGKDKIIGISECGSVPDVDTAFRDRSVWSFFGLMDGEYVSDSKDGYSEKYTSKDTLIKVYNSEGTLTLDEINTTAQG